MRVDELKTTLYYIYTCLFCSFLVVNAQADAQLPAEFAQDRGARNRFAALVVFHDDQFQVAVVGQLLLRPVLRSARFLDLLSKF